MTRHGLTSTQRKTMTFIEAFEAEHSYAPSFEEIREAMGWASKSNVHRVIARLKERGFVSLIPNSARSITILKRAA